MVGHSSLTVEIDATDGWMRISGSVDKTTVSVLIKAHRLERSQPAAVDLGLLHPLVQRLS